MIQTMRINIAVLGIAIAAGAALVARAADEPLDAETKARVERFEKGPATVDVSKYPDGIKENYEVLFLCSVWTYTQEEEVELGHAIGKVSTSGDLIVMELDEGALGKPNQFDLVGRTLRFNPERSGYRVENGPLHWDSDFGPETAGAEVTLHQFEFPFSGQQWNSFLVGRTGSISFGKRIGRA